MYVCHVCMHVCVYVCMLWQGRPLCNHWVEIVVDIKAGQGKGGNEIGGIEVGEQGFKHVR